MQGWVDLVCVHVCVCVCVCVAEQGEHGDTGGMVEAERCGMSQQRQESRFGRQSRSDAESGHQRTVAAISTRLLTDLINWLIKSV